MLAFIRGTVLRAVHAGRATAFAVTEAIYDDPRTSVRAVGAGLLQTGLSGGIGVTVDGGTGAIAFAVIEAVGWVDEREPLAANSRLGGATVDYAVGFGWEVFAVERGRRGTVALTHGWVSSVGGP